MRSVVWMLATASLFSCGMANAASRVVEYAPPAAWVIPPPKPTDGPSPPGAPTRFIFADWQVRLGPKGKEIYTAYRVKLLTPQGLAAGSIAGAWNPASDDVIVHRLNIIRGDQVIDVLKTSKFQIIQRENNLENAMLDGQLTATLQAPGLRVGDEIDFAMTIRHRDPTFGDRTGDTIQLPVLSSPGAYRARLLWPKTDAVQLRMTPDLGKPTVTTLGGEVETTLELRDPNSVILTDGAPAQYNIRRFIQFSSYSDWSEVSKRVAPLFDQASRLAPNATLRAEAQRIAASTTDPVARTEAALALVQEQIRYVYVGLDGGNYRPADAEETWERRFGDCKAKTAMLLALLRELGISAEAVLVHSNGGDGIDTLLPSPRLFDHVLVRAKIGDKTYWLDGTRPGDGRLANIPAAPFRWVLPVRDGGATLEKVPFQILAEPLERDLIRVDASGGYDQKAEFEVRRVLRGDDALVLNQAIKSLSPEDAKRGLASYWRAEFSWVEPETMTWDYDADTNALTLLMNGEGAVEWEGDEKTGRRVDIYRSGFFLPTEMKRPAEQDQTAPWIVPDFPGYRCHTAIIKLPPAPRKFEWDYSALPVNRRVGGIQYWREVGLENGMVRVTRSTRTYTPELTAAEAKAAVDAIPGFDNKVSFAYQRPAGRKPVLARGEPVSWNGEYGCQPSAGPAGSTPAS